jgi:hypothetical protein
MRELCVCSEERNPLDERLRDQEPVERIFVQRWEGIDVDRVLAGDRQLE